MARLVKDSGILGKAGEDLTAKNLNQKVSFDQIVEAIHVTQERMGIAGTTAKEASTTIEGSVNSMKSAWQNLVTGLANGNADVVGLTKNLLDSAKTVFGNVVPVLKQTLSGISEFMVEVAPAIGEELPKIVSDLLPVIMNGAMELITGLTTGLLNGLPQLTTVAIQVVQSLISGIMEKLPEFLDTAISILDTIASGISNNVGSLSTSAILIVSQLAQMLITRIPELVQVALELIKGLAKGLLNGLPELVKQIPIIINGLINAILESIPMMIDAGVELLTSLADGLPEIIEKLVQIAPEIVENIAESFIKNAPKLAIAGVKLFSALIKNMPKIIFLLSTAPIRIIASLVNAFISGGVQLATAGFKLLKNLFKNIPSVISYGREKVKQILDSVKDRIMSFSLVQAGVNLIKGLWSGIVQAKDWLFGKVEDLGNGLVKKVKDIFKIKSPSRVFAEIGKFLALGLGKGWEDAFPNVQNGIEDDLSFDVGQAVSDIEASVSTTGTDGGMYTLTDMYHMMSRILESIEMAGMNTVSAIENTDTSIVLNDRELGRAVRKAYA